MENKEELALFIMTGTSVLLLLFVAIIVFILSYQRKIYKNRLALDGVIQSRQIALFEASSMAEERQKENISRNIHDEVKPMLILLARHLEKKEQTYSNISTSLSFDKEYIIIDKVFDSLSHITDELVPTFINEEGLLKSLNAHLQDLNALGQIRFTSNLNTLTLPENKFSHNQLLTMYRIFLEILSNIIKHSGCNEARVFGQISTAEICFNFWHNGTGISNEEVANQVEENKGLGLKSIKARTLLLNGNLNFKSGKLGSEIDFTAPIPSNPV